MPPKANGRNTVTNSCSQYKTRLQSSKWSLIPRAVVTPTYKVRRVTEIWKVLSASRKKSMRDIPFALQAIDLL